MANSFEISQPLQIAEKRVRTSFVYVTMVLRNDLNKVKLAMMTLKKNLQGMSGPDEFLSLEITAKHQEEKLKANQNN